MKLLVLVRGPSSSFHPSHVGVPPSPSGPTFSPFCLRRSLSVLPSLSLSLLVCSEKLLEGLKDVRGLQGFGEGEAGLEEEFQGFDKYESAVMKKGTTLLMKFKV